MTHEQLQSAFPGEFTQKAKKHIDAQIRRHGKEESIRKARVYGEGLIEGLALSAQDSKSRRKDRIMQNFGSIDGARTQKNGKPGFSFTNLAIGLLETTGTYIDYVHTRNFPHQVAVKEGQYFYHPGIE